MGEESAFAFKNGFKCHTMSESHQRQLLLFADNQTRFMDEFSRTFKSDFLLTLRRRFGTKRVNANIVYQEYISDRNHTHMNATKWLTLTNFCQYLGKSNPRLGQWLSQNNDFYDFPGREGVCVVDQTEKGWFIQYIDRDPETLRRQEELEKKRKLDIDDRERQIIFIEKQVGHLLSFRSWSTRLFIELLEDGAQQAKRRLKAPIHWLVEDRRKYENNYFE
jgi:DNA/RNA-binding protein KIN17